MFTTTRNKGIRRCDCLNPFLWASDYVHNFQYPRQYSPMDFILPSCAKLYDLHDSLRSTANQRLGLSVPLKATAGTALWRFSWSSFGDPNQRRSSKLPKRKQFLHSDGAQARKKTDFCPIQFFDKCERCHDGVTESPKVVSNRRGGRRKSIAAETGITTHLLGWRFQPFHGCSILVLA